MMICGKEGQHLLVMRILLCVWEVYQQEKHNISNALIFENIYTHWSTMTATSLSFWCRRIWPRTASLHFHNLPTL
jgi:hypothetical protein